MNLETLGKLLPYSYNPLDLAGSSLTPFVVLFPHPHWPLLQAGGRVAAAAEGEGVISLYDNLCGQTARHRSTFLMLSQE